jgi:hypothetical protein
MTMDLNALPPHWATPALSGNGWPSLLNPGAEPVLVNYGTTRTNQTADPRMKNFAYWSVAGVGITKTLVSTGLQYDFPASTAIGAFTYQAAVLPANPGDIVGGSYEVTVPLGYPAISLTMYIAAYTSGGSSNGSGTIATTIVVNPGETRTITANPYTLPALSAGYRSLIRNSAITSASPSRIIIRNVLAEKGLTTPVGGYFDGSTQFTDGRKAAWNGAADASTSTLVSAIAGVPTQSASYSIITAPNTRPQRGCVLLVPPTMQLNIGFSGTASGGGVLRVQPIGLDGSLGTTQDLVLLDPASTTLINTTFRGDRYSAIIVYFDSTAVGTSVVTLNNGKAVYSALGTTPVLTGLPVPGQGHSGLRITDEPSIAYNYLSLTSTVEKRYITAAAGFTEVGAWV